MISMYILEAWTHYFALSVRKPDPC